jgi:activating signal cointegrator 1
VKALTLRQPFASLVVAGLKKIETRSWAPKYRGRIAIHAGGSLSPAEARGCHLPPFGRALASLEHDTSHDLPRGAVLGEVTLVDCLRMSTSTGLSGHLNISPGVDPRLRGDERAFGVYAVDRWAWLLADPIPYEATVHVQGQLGLWEWEGPCPSP